MQLGMAGGALLPLGVGGVILDALKYREIVEGMVEIAELSRFR